MKDVVVYDDDDIRNLVIRCRHDLAGIDLLRVLDSLKTPVERADLFRYVVLWKNGGIYSDLDTICAKPLHTWLHPDDHCLVGLEANVNNKEKRKSHLARNVQFCQWTLCSEPRHPVFEKVLRLLGERCHEGEMPIIEKTGPGAWTDAVAWYLDGMGRSPKDVVKGGKCGSIRFLAIDAFGSGQKHSQSTDRLGMKRLLDAVREDPKVAQSTPPGIYVIHLFEGSWKKKGRKKPGESDLRKRRRARLKLVAKGLAVLVLTLAVILLAALLFRMLFLSDGP